jgi:serine/threonine protein kinase
MDIDLLNEILDFVGIPFLATEKIPLITGQRKVYIANKKAGVGKYIIKVSASDPIATARLQREIKILNELDSIYFPKFLHNSYVTSTNLVDYYDNIDVGKEKERLEKIIQDNLKPFFITIEDFVPHVTWASCAEELKSEKKFVDFLIHIFTGMTDLWNAKIVHRDLKPDNILIKNGLVPVIIDLGIAKSFNPGTIDLTHAFFNTPCTPSFASPEQLSNNRNEITYKSDQFSIGVIAFLVLTGEFPYGNFNNIGPEALLKNFKEYNVLNLHQYNKSISEDLVSVIYKLIQVKPYKRFRDPKSILQKLNEIRGRLS